jgi:hypothetical protein
MKWRRLAAAAGASLLAVLITQATTFNFKSGATFEGEVVEVRGTNSVLARSDKDGKEYEIKLSYLTDADQKRITGNIMSAEEYFAGYRAARQKEKEEEAKTLPEQPESEAKESGKIVGGFGLRLGQRFDLKYSTGTLKFPDAVTVNGATIFIEKTNYSFRPKVPLPGFDFYCVGTTPRSNYVYIISAMKTDFDSFVAACNEHDRVLKVLEQKYGKATLTSYPEVQYNTITQDKREVMLTFGSSTNSGPSLTITYKDTALYQQAKQEQMEIDAADPARQAERKRLKQQL